MTQAIFDVSKIRQDFPMLHQNIHGKGLVYFDNAATAPKPQVVIDTINDYYSIGTSNVHRGVHWLSEQATIAYDAVRDKTQAFINAKHNHEIIFTSGTTDSINLIAMAMRQDFLQPGDEILVSEMEHHSNLVPWQMAAKATGTTLIKLPLLPNGSLDMEAFPGLLNERTKLVAVTHASNALGTINPVKDIIALAHKAGAKVLIDGAQAVPHFTVDVQDLDADFYAFSSHKMFGPTGVGVLYGKEDLLNELPPVKGGGDMILNVEFEKSIYNTLPYKFEAGTPPIANVLGLGAAIDYLNSLDMKAMEEYEASLLKYGTDLLSSIDGVTLIGTADTKVPVLSFDLHEIHPHDIGTLLDQDGIAVRTGHHCSQTVMRFYKLAATTRASLSFFNTTEELDRLAQGIKSIQRMFA